MIIDKCKKILNRKTPKGWHCHLVDNVTLSGFFLAKFSVVSGYNPVTPSGLAFTVLDASSYRHRQHLVYPCH